MSEPTYSLDALKFCTTGATTHLDHGKVEWCQQQASTCECVSHFSRVSPDKMGWLPAPCHLSVALAHWQVY